MGGVREGMGGMWEAPLAIYEDEVNVEKGAVNYGLL